MTDINQIENDCFKELVDYFKEFEYHRDASEFGWSDEVYAQSLANLLQGMRDIITHYQNKLG